MTGNGKEKINRITKEYLKRETLEFDIGCIYKLNLSSLGIFDLGCIGECKDLIVLDLCNNSISSTKSLAPLKQLQILKLANNRLSDLSGLEELNDLYSLDVAGNFLNSVHSLFPLKNLSNLESLRLSDFAKGLSNPVCQTNKSYRQEVLEMINGLKLFEGELVTGKGREFSEFCGNLDVALKEREKEVSERRQMSYERVSLLPGNMDHTDTDVKEQVSATERKVFNLIKDCEHANERAKNAIMTAEHKKVG